jgi:hypothetical protein
LAPEKSTVALAPARSVKSTVPKDRPLPPRRLERSTLLIEAMTSRPVIVVPTAA